MAKLIVGIDFGTSTTVVRYRLDDSEHILPVKDANGMSDIIPSVIFRPADGSQTLYGHNALTANESGMEGQFITNFKLGLINDDSEQKACIEEFMKYVYQCFRTAILGVQYDSMEVNISNPAKWTDKWIRFMKEAVRKAGFDENINNKPEPEAATYNLLSRHLDEFIKKDMLTTDKPMHVLMLDMGAGTTDIVIFRMRIDAERKVTIDHLLTYPAADNPHLCGGREIDEVLRQHILAYIREKIGFSGIDEDSFNLSEAKLWKETASKILSGGQDIKQLPNLIETTIKVIKKSLSEKGLQAWKSFVFSRSTFEATSHEHWEALYNMIYDAIETYKQEYGIGAEDIDLLYRTGGHSQWYTVANLFNGEGIDGTIGKGTEAEENPQQTLNFKKLKAEPWRMFNDALPHECVAMGLCLQDTIEVDIIPVSTNNVWVKLTVDNQQSSPIRIIKRGEILPVKREHTYTIIIKRKWTESWVFNVEIDVFTGTTLDTAKHRKLRFKKNEGAWYSKIFGTIVLFGIPLFMSKKASWSFTLKSFFKVNIDGTIDIEGDVLVNNKKSNDTHFTLNDLEEV